MPMQKKNPDEICFIGLTLRISSVAGLFTFPCEIAWSTYLKCTQKITLIHVPTDFKRDVV